MGLFRKKQKSAGDEGIRPGDRVEAPASAPDEPLQAVGMAETEQLVHEMRNEVVDVYPGEITDAEVVKYKAALLTFVGPERANPMSDGAFDMGVSVGRVGWLTRGVETARFDVDPIGDSEFGSYLRMAHSTIGMVEPDVDATVDICLRLAENEPRNAPPTEQSTLWAIPGSGAQVRNLLANDIIVAMTQEGYPAPLTYEDLLTVWRFGFLCCCAEEALA